MFGVLEKKLTSTVNRHIYKHIDNLNVSKFQIKMGDQKDILKDHSMQILECITTLKEQRNEIKSLIMKQLEERRTLSGEIEKLSHKLSLVCI